jgi:hypothetical protein
MYGNTTMSWSSKKEAIVALTSYETGYIAASSIDQHDYVGNESER